MEILETRSLLSGPQLVSIVPNTGGVINNGDLKTTAPRELTLHFSIGSAIDPNTLGGISFVRSTDGIFGNGNDTPVTPGFIGIGSQANQVVVRFADTPVDDLYRITITGALRDTSDQAFNNGVALSTDFRVDVGGQVVSVVPQPVLRAVTLNVLNAAQITNGDTFTLTLGGATSVFQFRQIGTPGAVPPGRVAVEYDAGASANSLATAIAAAVNSLNLGPSFAAFNATPSGANVSFSGGVFTPALSFQTTNAGVLRSQEGGLTQLDDIVNVYFTSNQLDPALAGNPAFYRLINTTTGTVLIPTAAAYNAAGNTTSLQFAGGVPTGIFRLQIGVPTSATNTIDSAVSAGTIFANTGDFRVIGVLGDVGGASGALNDVDMYSFVAPAATDVTITADQLASAFAGNVRLRLFDASGTELGSSNTNTLHVVGLTAGERYFVGVSSEGNNAYNPTTGAGSTNGVGFGSYRLTIAVTAVLTEASNTTSFATATRLGSLGAAGFSINSTIVVPAGQPALPPRPGGNDAPGRRQLPLDGESNEAGVGQVPVLPAAIPTRFFNFASVYGVDAQGNTLFNAITENQKQRAREIFSILGRQVGVEFVETANQGLQIITGDVRAADPRLPPTIGGVNQGNLVIINAGLDFGASEYGGEWFFIAFHEIGHGLGLAHSYDAPSIMGAGLAGIELVYPGDVNLVPARRLMPANSTDINLYRFELDRAGTLTAETIAQRLAPGGVPNPSLLDSVLTLYSEAPANASVSTDFGTNSAATITFTARAAGTAGDGITINVLRNDLGANNGPTVSVAGNVITVTLNTNLANQTTALELLNVFNGNAAASALASASLLGTATTIISATAIPGTFVTAGGGQLVRSIVARNDNYFGRDSFLNLRLEAGTYYLGVTASGNTNFDPNVANSGIGGRTDGDYELRLNFTPDPAPTQTLNNVRGVALDGDADNAAGGVFDFWFRAGPTLFVDKLNAAGLVQDGSIANPFSNIAQALAAADPALGGTPGTIVRIVGNGGGDGNVATASDANPYLIGFDSLNNPAVDGRDFRVPQHTTVMIDAGAVLKLKNAIIDVGNSSPNVDRSGGALQVLGTPGKQVLFTSLDNDAIGGRSDPNDFDGPRRGDWGGLVFRQASDVQQRDFQDHGIFLNWVNNANITFGGGQVVDDSVRQVFSPIHVSNPNPRGEFIARPTVWFNTISQSADAAMSADPNSFANTLDRVGPNIRKNVVTNNSINGVFVRIRTSAGVPLDTLDLPARFASTDIVYVVPENLFIQGGTGGPLFDGTNWDARVAGSLVIDPGAIVKLSGARIELQIGSGQLLAEGTAFNPIIFTSLRDDTYGAGGTFDTGNDGATTPTRGDWGGLFFNASTTGSIDHAIIRYGGGTTPIAGGFDNFNAVTIQQADVRIANSRFEFNAGGASAGNRNGLLWSTPATIFVRGSQPVIVGNTFTDNLGAVVSINANALNSEFVADWGRSTGPLGAFTQFVSNQGVLVRLNRLGRSDSPVNSGNNGINGMVVRGESITTETVWDDTDIVHVVLDEIHETLNRHTFGGIRLQSSPIESLVVKLFGANAGFRVNGTPLDIEDRIGGTLQIIGQPQRPVVFTSLRDDTVGAGLRIDGQPQRDTNGDFSATVAAPGNWRSIILDRYSNDRNVKVIRETESPISSSENNGTPATAQFIGTLATSLPTDNPDDKKAGNDDQPLGFEVHGRIARPGDRDVFGFLGIAGSEVWIDIGRTSPALQTVLELIDANGNVLATSNPRQGILSGLARPMMKDAWLGGDFYTSNPNDAGMRVVLPGTPGLQATYFVRVRSDQGITQGDYTLQIRLRQQFEAPGSTIRYADIRFATNGIDIRGLPANSPLVGETGSNGQNTSFAAAQNLGNLLTSDRSTISVAGNIQSPGQVDWYRFTLNYDLIQAIPGVNAGDRTWATIFDIDYADGLARGDLTISVFDSQGRLILVSRDSNVSDDQPEPNHGVGTTDLARGTVGKLDPYIGTVMMPTGTPPVPGPGSQFEYFVAISSNARLPTALQGTFQSGAANTLVRLEPVNSVRRIVQDHIGFTGFTTGDRSSNSVVPPTTPAILPISTVAELQASVRPFTFGDVALFRVNSVFDLGTVNPALGTTHLSNIGSIGSPGVITSSKIQFRSDGTLWAYQGLLGVDNTVGRLVRINPNTGAVTVIGNDGIPNFDPATTPPNPNQTTSDVADAFTWVRRGVQNYDLYYVTPGGPDNTSKLYRANPANGSAVVATGQPWGFVGFITDGSPDFGRTTGLAEIDGTLFGVTSTGRFFRMHTNGAATVLSTFGLTSFTSLAAGPPNVHHGQFADILFATETTGHLIAIDSLTARPMNVFGATGGEWTAAIGPAPGGVAFSPLDFNLWHPTFRRPNDAGHGILPSFDNSRNTPGAYPPRLVGSMTDARSQSEAQGGAKFYFGLENWSSDPVGSNSYFQYGVNAQYGILTRRFHEDLTSNTAESGFGNNFNMPGGAHGSLITGAFSLEGYSYNDKPTLYFNYFLQTEGASGANGSGNMLDSARVFASRDGGTTWEMLASNNPTLSVPGSPAELSTYISQSSAENPGVVRQRIQPLHNSASWRQARIDLGDFAGESNIRLRFDFSTAGVAIRNGVVEGGMPGNATGAGLSDNRRVSNNTGEGFFIDDIIVGLAERGEMVTGATADSSFFAVPQNPAPNPPQQSLTGPYQLEIRRGHEYAANISGTAPEIELYAQFDSNTRFAPAINIVVPTGFNPADGQTFTISDGLRTVVFEFDSNASVTTGRRAVAFTPGASAAAFAAAIRNAVNAAAVANLFTVSASLGDGMTGGNPNANRQVNLNRAASATGAGLSIVTNFSATSYRRGDRNTVRDQGSIQIYGNSVQDVSGVGILVRAGDRDFGTANLPHPGSVRNLSTLNPERLVPGVNIVNNVIANFVTAGIQFSGDAGGTGLAPAAVPFGRIVNNTIFGAMTPRGVGIQVTNNASPTILNNIVANTVTGIQIDGSSASTVVGTTVFQRNTSNGTVGTNAFLLSPADPLFVAPHNRNFYLAPGSLAIDSSLNSLQDRPGIAAVKTAIGIPQTVGGGVIFASPSPILAPDRDFFGQLRLDDPSVPNALGLGQNIFKDRGAIDRADFVSPVARLVDPLDNDPAVDGDSANNRVFIISPTTIVRFAVQLADQGGVGIDPSTVTSTAVQLRQNGVLLTEGIGGAYLFRYNEITRTIEFLSTSVFPSSGHYLITLDNNVIRDLAGNRLAANRPDGSTTFQIIGNAAPSLTFVNEFASSKNVPRIITYAQLLAASDLTVVAGHSAFFRIEASMNGVTEIQLGGAGAFNSVVPGTTLIRPGDVLRWTPPVGVVGSTAAFSVIGFDPQNAAIAPSLSLSSPPITVNINPRNDAPTLTTISTLGGGVEDTPFHIPFAAFLAATNAADLNGDPISFRIQSVTSGTLQIDQGGVVTTVVPGTTIFSAGDSLIWTPPAHANNINNGGNPLSAFTVVASDGELFSTPAVLVRVHVASQPDAPLLTNVNTLALAGLNSPFRFTFADILNNSDASNIEGNAIHFRVESIAAGATLQIQRSGVGPFVPVVPGTTVVSAGDRLIWTPPLNVSGSAVPAFTVVNFDAFNAVNHPGFEVSSPPVQVRVNTLNVPAPTLTQVQTFNVPRGVPTPITYAQLLANSNATFTPGHSHAFRITSIDNGTLTITRGGVTTDVVPGTTLFQPGDTLTWTRIPFTGSSPAFRIIAVDLTTGFDSFDPVQVTVNLQNFAPTLTSVDLCLPGYQQSPLDIPFSRVLARSNAFDPNGDPLSFVITSTANNGSLLIRRAGTTIQVPVQVGTPFQPGDVITWTPNAGVLGSDFPIFTVIASDGQLTSSPNVQVSTSVTGFGAEFNLSGAWQFNGRLTRINQTGNTLTFVNENGQGAAGRFLDRGTVIADPWGGLVGQIDFSRSDFGRIVWANNSVWTRVTVGGQYINQNGALTSVIQSATDLQLTFVNAAGGRSAGVIQSPTQLLATTWNLRPTFDGTTINFGNGSIWRRLDLPPTFSSSIDGSTTQVISTGGTTLTLIDRFCQSSSWRWINASQIRSLDGTQTATIGPNNVLTFNSGEVWTPAPANPLNISFTQMATLGPAHRGAVFEIPYARLLGASDARPGVSFRLTGIDNGVGLQVRRSGQQALNPAPVGTVINPGDTLVLTPPSSLVGNELNVFSVVATQGVSTSNRPVQARLNILPFGSINVTGAWSFNNQLASINTNNLTVTNEGGATSPIVFDAWNRIRATAWGNLVGTFDTTTADNGRILWSNGAVWLRIMVGGTWAPVGVNMAVTSIAQSGPDGRSLLFTNRFGASSPGMLISPTTVVATGWGIHGSITNNVLTFSNGSQWRKLDLSPVYNSPHGPVQILQDGSTNLVFVDPGGARANARFVTPTSIAIDALGIPNSATATINGGTILVTAPGVPNVTLTKALTLFGTQNGTGNVSIMATNNVISLTDRFGVVTNFRALSASLLQALVGGTQLQRQGSRLVTLGGGPIFDNFNINALNAVFSDIQSFPFP